MTALIVSPMNLFSKGLNIVICLAFALPLGAEVSKMNHGVESRPALLSPAESVAPPMVAVLRA
ncbi:MAG: hypothetical protein MN733_42285 [Nitrososphaera sp.]|nr:hypothetical protein [Nitrososphaera sp.]